MTVVFPTYQNDCKQLFELLVWIQQLGNLKRHDALIVADCQTPWAVIKDCQRLAGSIFKEARILSTKEHVSGWPKGPNFLFRTAANYISNLWPQPWLWMEPDTTPLRTGWLDQIEAEYQACGKHYMGHIYSCNQPGLVNLLLSGVSVYHANTAKDLVDIPDSPRAFDMDFADLFVSHGAHTDLIYNLFGEKDNPPRFSNRAIPGTSMFSLDSIPLKAVLFHRVKNGSLIRELRRKMGIASPLKNGGFVVVIPFYNGDARLALKNIKWQKELGGSERYDCLLACESTTNQAMVDQIEIVARSAYKNVSILNFIAAPNPGWPRGPNWAFQHVAYHMQQMNRPWLWMETDFFALVPEWLERLQEEYNSCGKAFMGHIVDDFGHLQGTSVYPADLPIRCPKVMQCSDIAFDTVSKDEMLADCHKANELFCHIWGIHGDTPHHFTGTPIHFSTVEQVKKWVPEGAVTLHRCKDGSIADRLREMKS